MGIDVWVSRPEPGATPVAGVVVESSEPLGAEKRGSSDTKENQPPAENPAQHAPQHQTAPSPAAEPVLYRQYGDWVFATTVEDPMLDQIAWAIHGRSIRGVKASMTQVANLVIFGESLAINVQYPADHIITAGTTLALRASAAAKRQLWRELQQRIHVNH